MTGPRPRCNARAERRRGSCSRPLLSPVSQQMLGFLMAFCALSAQVNQALSIEPPPVLDLNYYTQPSADVLLAGLFPVHTFEKQEQCKRLQAEEGIEPLEAMLYTIDKLNKMPKFSKHFTIGSIAMDTCDNKEEALRLITPLLTVHKTEVEGSPAFVCPANNPTNTSPANATENAKLSTKAEMYAKVIGIVGARRSEISMSVASLVQYFNIPQISYLSTSSDLSNYLQYSTFLRTVPSDFSLARVFVQIMLTFRWTYISVVHDDSSYGIRGVRHIIELGMQSGICFPLQLILPTRSSGSSPVEDPAIYERIVQQLDDQKQARVVLLYSSGRQQTRLLLQKVAEKGLYDRFIWLGPDGIADKTSLTDTPELQRVMNGSIAIMPNAHSIPSFDDYFSSLGPTNPRNRFWKEFWQDKFNCTLNASSAVNTTRPCTGNETLAGFQQKLVLHFVSDAVYAFAHALLQWKEDECSRNNSQFCNGRLDASLVFDKRYRQNFLNTLRNVTFRSITNETFNFVNSINGPTKYTVQFYQTDSNWMFTEGWQEVGRYTENGSTSLTYDEDNDDYMVDPDDFILDEVFKLFLVSTYPSSVCSEECKPLQAKLLLEFDGCCWICRNCTDRQIKQKVVWDEDCVDCPLGSLPNSNKNVCIPIHPQHMGYSNALMQGVISFSSLGMILTIATTVLFVKYHKTPVIKASGLELCYVLLVGVFLLFGSVFIYVSEPSVAICTLTRILIGLTYALVYASLLVKTNRIARIFRQVKQPKYISARYQIVFTSLLVLVQMIVLTAWLLASKPAVTSLYPTYQEHIVICQSAENSSYLIPLAYPLLLLICCTVYAFKTRKTPDGFNEARSIAFLCCTTVIAWLAFVTLLLTATNFSNEGIKQFIFSLASCLNATAVLACIFWQKLVIAIWHPEKNTKATVMARTKSASLSSVGLEQLHNTTASRSPRKRGGRTYTNESMDTEYNTQITTFSDHNTEVITLSSLPTDPVQHATDDHPKVVKIDTSVLKFGDHFQPIKSGSSAARDASLSPKTKNPPESCDKCLQTDISFHCDWNATGNDRDLMEEFCVVPEKGCAKSKSKPMSARDFNMMGDKF